VIAIDGLFFVVVSRGKANTVLRKAKKCGVTGGTIFLGEGTVQNRHSDKLGQTEIHKEILMLSTSDELFDQLYRETLMFLKKNEGIAFSIPFKRWQLPADGQEQMNISTDVHPSHFCIMTIVDRGRSKACIKAARAAGAMGATVIHGRGAGIPTDFYFPLVIEPQKDMVMIITKKDNASLIRQRILSDLKLEKAGNGIIFTLPVNWTGGLLESRSEENGERTT
jgi:nitrogen regulatory protein PII